MAEQLTPDICVIGAGAGGLSMAAAAASFGVPVVLIERGRMSSTDTSLRATKPPSEVELSLWKLDLPYQGLRLRPARNVTKLE